MKIMTENAMFYKRKSGDSEDKQILSLDSQDRVIRENIPGFDGLNIITDYEESMSAKAPGRPKFNQMCEKLESGQAQYIICWQLNRLARNPVDGGRIIWLVQNFGIKIITPSKTYDVNDILLMYVEFAMSNQFINDLRKNSARGVEDKIRAGRAPILAPLGYYNDVTKKQGLRDILPDPQRFELVRKMWDLLLTGQYSPIKILTVATEEWGLRQRNGKPLSRSKIYELFRSIFYTGQFLYEGEVHQGIHQPMITLDEYDRAQKILGKRGNPRMVGHQFTYARLIKCICGHGVTAHERYRKICTNCHYKYNAEKNDFCPKCETVAPEKTWYVCYYYCTNRNHPGGRVYIREAALEIQIDKVLESIYLPQEFTDWTLKQLRKVNQEESQGRESINTNLQASLAATTRKLDNLLSKFLSDENRSGELISDEEYLRQKDLLQVERKQLEDRVKAMGNVQDNWIDTAEKVFDFARNARYWFNNGTKEQKRTIVSTIGMNLVLNNRLLRCDLPKPFDAIKQGVEILENTSLSYEPDNQVQNEALWTKSPLVGG